MNTTKPTTPKSLQIKLQHQVTKNATGESFRVLYYGTAAAGSVPFMWESQPGTPKHALTESSLPPLTPPPSYHKNNQKYNSSMQFINQRSSKRSGIIRNIFHAYSSLMSKTEARRMISVVEFGLEEECGEPGRDGGGSPRSGWCLGGRVRRSCRVSKMKKAIQWFVRHGK